MSGGRAEGRNKPEVAELGAGGGAECLSLWSDLAFFRDSLSRLTSTLAGRFPLLEATGAGGAKVAAGPITKGYNLKLFITDNLRAAISSVADSV